MSMYAYPLSSIAFKKPALIDTAGLQTRVVPYGMCWLRSNLRKRHQVILSKLRGIDRQGSEDGVVLDGGGNLRYGGLGLVAFMRD
jgi:hypothetical protein